MPARFFRAHALLAGIATGLLALASVSNGTPSVPPRHQGVATCASTTCHGAARPLAGTAVQQNEYVTWSEFDPHAGAFRTLRDERSTVIARRLGLGAADQAPACLACHSEVVATAQRGPKFQQDDGIGCEACHGAAEDWLAGHDDRTPGARADSLRSGLRPLHEPAVRAGVCTACHVGSHDRLATHAMLAAGHPRLSFELDTFSELWRTSGGREHFRRDSAYAARKPAVASTQVWLTGLVQASLASVDQLPAAVGRRGLPEFAAFNCYSCHRNMGRSSSDASPVLVSGDLPGTLRLNDSAPRLLATALAAQDPQRAAGVVRGLRELQRAANEDRVAVAPAAAALHSSLESLGRTLARAPISAAERHAMLTAVLRASAAGAYPDYASAEQAAMAVVVLLADADGNTRRAADLDALFAALDDDAAFDQRRFARMLGRLGEIAKPRK